MAQTNLLSVVAVLCFALVINGAFAAPRFTVEGRVYCDTCRAGFETSVTQYLEGANIRLECRHYETGNVEYSVDGVTEANGFYKIEAEESHDEDICEVVLVKSATPGCSEKSQGRDRARIILSHDSGISSTVRHANSLGFLKDEPLPVCGQLLQQYALGTYDD